MNLKKIFSLICLSVCFLSAFAQEIDLESLYRSSALPTGNALLAFAADGTKTDKAALQTDAFWNSMGWSIGTTGDKGTPWLLPAGTKALPYQRTGQFTFAPSAEISVGSKAELKALLGAYRPHRVTLTRPIDFEGDTINTLFEIGTFDGQGYTISNFVLQKHPSFDKYGFFYRVDSVLNLTLEIKSFTQSTSFSSVGLLTGHLSSGGVIRNCHVKPYQTNSITVTGADYVGGLVGDLEGTIDGCSIKGINVSGTSYIGGMVGRCNTATAKITTCSVDSVAVTASSSYVGGLIGFNRATIDSCSATRVVVTGSTNGDSYAGGLVGQNHENLVKNSKVTIGTITGKKFLGGLVGHTLSGSLSNDTVSSVTITATDEQVGGLTGYLFLESSATNCKAKNITISGLKQIGGLVGLLNGSILSSKVDSSTVSGASKIGGMVGECDTAIAEITNCAVDSIAVTASGSYVGGLIGFNRATIDSCSATRVVVKSTAENGDSYVGGLVGQNNDKDVKNSKVTNSTITGNKCLGGLVGHTLSGSLSNDTVSNVIITATDEQVGGLTGYLFSGSSATNCKANRVTVSGTGANSSKIGGLVGLLDGSITTSKVDSSSISGASNIGGMVGSSSTSTTSKITTCSVDSVAVTATGSYAGGLIGLNRITIDGCSATRVVVTGSTNSNLNSYAGGLVGQNNEKDVKNSKVTNSKITGYKCLGGLVGHTLSGSLSNDTVSNVTVAATNDQAGGLTSYIVGEQNATNCKANRVTVSGVDQIGGLVGLLDGKIVSCKVDTSTVSGSSSVGGIVGKNEGASATITSCSIDSVRVSGSVSAVGGIAGYQIAAISGCNVKRSIITSVTQHAGGISGYSTGSITSCKVDTTSISSAARAGGVVGENATTTGSIATCSVDSVRVSGSASAVGGIAGFQTIAVSGCDVKRSIISGANNAGGIAGTSNGTITSCSIDSVRVSGSASAVGGIAGYQYSSIYTCNVKKSIIQSVSFHAGGISGYSTGNIISCKVDTTSISGTYNIGGVVGEIATSIIGSKSIDLCYIDSVRVSGSSYQIGGIAGYNYQAILDKNTVNNSMIASGTASSYTGSYVGGIAGNNSGTITGGIVRGGSVDLYISYASGIGICNGVGGIAGTNGASKTISGSMVLGTKITLNAKDNLTNQGCGGIAGNNYGGTISTSLSSNVTVKTISESNAATGIGTGGIVGNSALTSTVEKCLTKENTITGEYYIGGVVGRVPTDATVALNNCHVHGGVISTSLANTTSDVYQGGIVGYFRGTVENCLVTNTVIRNYITNPVKLYIGGIVGGSETNNTTIKNNKAMIDYFDIRAKFTKGGRHFGRVYGGDNPTTEPQGNQGWAETYIKYYHKKFGINWNFGDYYFGPGMSANNTRNGENLFVGDTYTSAIYKSMDNDAWTLYSMNFNNGSWDLTQLGTKKFAVLQTFKDSSYALLVANRGNEYLENLWKTHYTAPGDALNVPIKIFSPRAFNFGYGNWGCNFLYFSANKVDLYTDILLEEDNSTGNSTFWAVDLNGDNAGNTNHSLVSLINTTTFEFDGHGYSIDGYDNSYTGDNYGESSLIRYITNCNYTVKRLEVANFRRHFVLPGNSDQRIFGTLIDKVDSSSTFEDIYIKSPYIAIADDEYIGDFDYLGGLVGQITKGTVNFTRVAAYMSVGPTLYTKYKGYLGGIVGYVGGGSVSLNNVATCLTANFYTRPNTSSSQGFYIGYKVDGISAPYSNSWFKGTLVDDFVTNKRVPLENTGSTGTFFDALGASGAKLSTHENWHYHATIVDSIYLVRDTIADDGWGSL